MSEGVDIVRLPPASLDGDTPAGLLQLVHTDSGRGFASFGGDTLTPRGGHLSLTFCAASGSADKGRGLGTPSALGE